MITLLLILIIAAWLHLKFMGLLSEAAQEHRLEIVRGYKALKHRDAPDWLLEFWTNAMPAMLVFGLLPKVLWYSYRSNKESRHQLACFLVKVRNLPSDQRKIHDKMDHHFAIILCLNAPYSMALLTLYTLVKTKRMKLASIIPHRDSRSWMVRS